VSSKKGSANNPRHSRGWALLILVLISGSTRLLTQKDALEVFFYAQGRTKKLAAKAACAPRGE